MKKRSLFFDTSLIYFIVIIAFVVLRIFTSLVSVGTTVSSLLSVIIQVGIMFLLPLVLYKFLRKKTTVQMLKEFNVKKINAKAVLWAIALGVVVYFLNLAFASFFSVFITIAGYDPSFGMASTANGTYPLINFFGDLVLTALLPGFCEEFCHRGLLLNGYKQLGPKKTIILIGIIFGLMHLNIEQFFYASIIGMFLTLLVYITGSIIPSMIVHFLNNAIGLYMTFAMYNNLPFGSFSSNLVESFQGNIITVFGTILLIIFLLLGLLVWFTFMLLKSTRVKYYETIIKRAMDKKQRESILSSFDLNIDEVNSEQGIIEDENAPEVVLGGEINKNGRRGLVLDINFKTEDIMGCAIKKPKLIEKMFLYSTIFIGVVITISTFIWGIL